MADAPPFLVRVTSGWVASRALAGGSCRDVEDVLGAGGVGEDTDPIDPEGDWSRRALARGPGYTGKHHRRR